jgi:hypothetical protein
MVDRNEIHFCGLRENIVNARKSGGGILLMEIIYGKAKYVHFQVETDNNIR